jgi:hypothetical protein
MDCSVNGEIYGVSLGVRRADVESGSSVQERIEALLANP